MYPHRMRLHGPWKCQPLEAGEHDRTLPQDREVPMPGRIREQGLMRFFGLILFQRSFGKPRQIDDWERVWLTFDRIDGSADIRLNGQWLMRKQSGKVAHDITSLLGERNRLEVYLNALSDEEGITGEVALEVRARAYLEDVLAKRGEDGSIQVNGKLRGDCADMLELYAILDRRNVHYLTLNCGSEGVSFAFTIPADEAKGNGLRIELVNRSQVWYVAELAV